MARLIKAVARCGLRFESGLPLGRVQRKGSAAAREATVANEGGEGARVAAALIVERRIGHIRWAEREREREWGFCRLRIALTRE